EMREVVRAKREYERILDTEPAHAGALSRLAPIAARLNDNKLARDYAARALKIVPSDTAAQTALVQADLNEKKYEEVLRRAAVLAGQQTASAVNRSIAQGLMADALDALGRPAEAFGWYGASNRTLKAAFAAQFEAPGTESALDNARRVDRYFKNAPPIAAAPASESPVETHVFLVGFPRSGTTMLEQVLASHPRIDALEERDCLMAAEKAFLGSDAALDRLMQASGAELEAYRDAYWAAAADAGAALDKPVFVDKLPLNALLLGIIARLFPTAKILLALRDPRDVVFSCYRRRFGMSLKMYELLTLERAAAFYAAIMDICMTAQAKFPMPVLVTRYEDTVHDLEGEARRLCAFLGVDYAAQMLSFADRARDHVVNTPSAAQVARGLYASGVGQWQAYRTELAGVLPTLAPWISRFGYPEAV
ncbi:MAG TPA: sulfotransferase, partial [Rhizomicrobium sp.]